jgi:hypothetical protein
MKNEIIRNVLQWPEYLQLLAVLKQEAVESLKTVSNLQYTKRLLPISETSTKLKLTHKKSMFLKVV